MRDDFTLNVKELIAKRVGLRCSNPGCRKPTSGPTADPAKALNVGVAAHITAASPGGPRYDSLLTPAKRRSQDNGIWLCQTCAKLIDNDEARYSTQKLREWKHLAEEAALKAIEGAHGSLNEILDIEKLETMMPELFAEMRQDLTQYPLRREFVLLKKGWVYNSKGYELAYYYDDHGELDSMMHVLSNNGLVTEITHNNVKRFLLSEALVKYLIG